MPNDDQAVVGRDLGLQLRCARPRAPLGPERAPGPLDVHHRVQAVLQRLDLCSAKDVCMHERHNCRLAHVQPLSQSMEELLQLGSAEVQRHAAAPLHQHRRWPRQPPPTATAPGTQCSPSRSRMGSSWPTSCITAAAVQGPRRKRTPSAGEALCQPSLSLKASMKVTFRSPAALVAGQTQAIAPHCGSHTYPRASRMSSAVRDKLTITIGLSPGQHMQYTQQEGRETRLEALRLSSLQAVR